MRNSIARCFYLLLCVPFFSVAQSSFTLSPEKPQPGDIITFTYTPPDGLVTDTAPLRCDAYKLGMYHDQMELSYFPLQIEIVKLTKNGNTYTGQFKTDAQIRFLSFTFSSGDMTFGYNKGGMGVLTGSLDNNNNQGYSTLFYNTEGQELPYSNLFGARYLDKIGVSNEALSIAMYERELASNPDSKVAVLPNMIRVLKIINPESAKIRAQIELEKIFKSGMNTEEDYILAGDLFKYVGLYAAEKYFSNRGEELFPNSTGLIGINVLKDQQAKEKDPVKQEQLNEQIEQLYANSTPAYRIFILNSHSVTYRNIDTSTYAQKAAVDFPFSFYGMIGWMGGTDAMIEKKDPKVLEKLDQHYAYTLARYKSLKADKDQIAASPSEKYMTSTERWGEVINRMAYLNYQYASYYNNTGAFKKAFGYAKKGFQFVEDGNFSFFRATNINKLYLSLAEKFAPKTIKQILEKAITWNKYDHEMTDQLKKIYSSENKTDAGFKDYYIALLRSNGHFDQEVANLLMSKPAPKFSLLNMAGEEVSKESLKGKIVVLDFWATWCGPCIASFPAMAELQESFKDREDVAFIFVNTSERDFNSYDELHQRIVDFLAKKELDFNVILDAQYTVAPDFGIGNLPTKVVLDKEGNIRYKVAGSETDSERLILEINAMIESIN